MLRSIKSPQLMMSARTDSPNVKPGGLTEQVKYIAGPDRLAQCQAWRTDWTGEIYCCPGPPNVKPGRLTEQVRYIVVPDRPMSSLADWLNRWNILLTRTDSPDVKPGGLAEQVRYCWPRLPVVTLLAWTGFIGDLVYLTRVDLPIGLAFHWLVCNLSF
jgi:hypothetical protein